MDSVERQESYRAEQLLLESTVQWRAPLLPAEVAVMVDMTAWQQQRKLQDEPGSCLREHHMAMVEERH